MIKTFWWLREYTVAAKIGKVIWDDEPFYDVLCFAVLVYLFAIFWKSLVLNLFEILETKKSSEITKKCKFIEQTSYYCKFMEIHLKHYQSKT